jgi:hypothetical protein
MWDGINLAESCNEDYGSKMGCFTMIQMIIMTIMKIYL